MRDPEPDHQLESLARMALKFHFINHGAEVVSNECLPGMGNSQIFIRVLDIEFRIIQSGGSFSVLAAPCHARESWQSVESLLVAIDQDHSLPPPPVYGSLADLGGLLESRLLLLNAALSRERFASTVQAARQSKMRDLIALKPSVAIQPSTARRVAGRLLERDFVKLNNAFSEAHYPVVRERIREISETLKQKWIEEFNQKSKSYKATVP